MFASISATALNILLNYICISQFGYLAAGYTTLVSYLVQATLDYFAMRKVVGESVYNMGYVGLLSGVMLVVALLSNMLYGYPVIRYLIIGALAVLPIVFKKQTVAILKSIKKK